MDNDTIFGGLLNLGYDDGALVPVVLVELQQILERVVADDIRVQDEEGGVVLGQNLLGELQGTGGVEGFGLDREFDVDVVLLLILKSRADHISQCYQVARQVSPSRAKERREH